MKNNIIFLAIAFCLLISCTKEKEILPTGSLIGYVNCEENDYSIIRGSNVKVTLYDNKPIRTVETNSIGKYTLDDIPVGNYYLEFSKEGYGTRYAEYTATSGNEPDFFSTVTILEKPEGNVSNVVIHESNEGILYFDLNLHSEKYCWVIGLVSSDSLISGENFDYTIGWSSPYPNSEISENSKEYVTIFLTHAGDNMSYNPVIKANYFATAVKVAGPIEVNH